MNEQVQPNFYQTKLIPLETLKPVQTPEPQESVGCYIADKKRPSDAEFVDVQALLTDAQREAVQLARAHDKVMFENNPESTFMLRQPFPGEFGDIAAEPLFVICYNDHGPGGIGRCRRPIRDLKELFEALALFSQ